MAGTLIGKSAPAKKKKRSVGGHDRINTPYPSWQPSLSGSFPFKQQKVHHARQTACDIDNMDLEIDTDLLEDIMNDIAENALTDDAKTDNETENDDDAKTDNDDEELKENTLTDTVTVSNKSTAELQISGDDPDDAKTADDSEEDLIIIDDIMTDMELAWLSKENAENSAHKRDTECADKIDAYIVQKYSEASEDDGVRFDRYARTKRTTKKTRTRICLLDSKGLRTGVHCWQVQILKSDVFLQEMGVVANSEIASLKVDRAGIQNTREFGAKSVFSSELCTVSNIHSMLLATFHEDGSRKAELTLKSRTGWRVFDVIEVKVDLEAWTIRYSRNGEQVGKVLPLPKHQVYHPVICFQGNCQYDLR